MKSVLVTGDSRGVGLAIVNTLLDNDFAVIGISRRESQDLKELKLRYPKSFTHLNFDLSNVEDIKEFFKKEIKPLGPIFALVNNAAIAYDDIITNLNMDPLREMYDVNVFSPMMLTKHVLRNMLFNKTKGNIIHISSISAHTGYKGLAFYASTKGAIEAFSKNTAREWGALGIRSNVICPGFMDTEMSASLSQEQKDRIFNRNSRKSPISVQDVANATLFLVGEAAGGITGEILHVDNGTI